MDPNFEIKDKPQYDPDVRALQDEDPASASMTFNPLLEKMVNNTHAVKLQVDSVEEKVEELQDSGFEVLKDHFGDKVNPHGVTAAQVKAIPTSQKGAAGGVAELGSDGKVPGGQLPSLDYDPKGSAANVQSNLSNHVGDTDLHVTAAKQNSWTDGAATANEAKTLAQTAQATAKEALDEIGETNAYVEKIYGDAQYSYNELIQFAIATAQMAGSAEQDASSAHSQANSAYNQANSAYNQANSAYTLANSVNTLALVANNSAANAYALANTANSTATTANITAEKANTTAANAYTLASSAISTNLDPVKIGKNATVSLDNSTAIGVNASATGINSTALGHGANASDANSIALGRYSIASSSGSVALGNAASAIKAGAVAIGSAAYATGEYSTALGRSANASDKQSIAVGSSAKEDENIRGEIR